jgi:hypothetical protein
MLTPQKFITRDILVTGAIELLLKPSPRVKRVMVVKNLSPSIQKLAYDPTHRRWDPTAPAMSLRNKRFPENVEIPLKIVLTPSSTSVILYGK